MKTTNKQCCKKRNYVSYGMIYGAGIGLCLGAVMGNVPLGLPIGAGIVMLLGLIINKKN